MFGALAVGLGVALIGFRRAVAQQRAAEAARAAGGGTGRRDYARRATRVGAVWPVARDGKTAGRRCGYYEGLPPELQNSSTDAAQAQALDALALVKQNARDYDASQVAQLRAIELWKKMVAERPNDPDAAAALLLGEHKRLHWFDQLKGFEALKAGKATS